MHHKSSLVVNPEVSTSTLKIAGGEVTVILKRSRRRTFQLSIDPTGEVTCRLPWSSSPERVQALLEDKWDWIARTRARVMRRLPKGRVTGYRNGAVFFVFGCARTLQVRIGAVEWPRVYEKRRGWLVLVPSGYTAVEQEKAVGEALGLWFRRQAEEYLSSRLELWARKMRLERPRLLLKRHKGLWGSCNKARRTINLNWKIIAFPSEVIDYVVIHELCHLQVADHSRRFWAEVLQWCPHWRPLRRWLKEEAYRHVLPAR